MKHFYIKSGIALAVIVLTLTFAFKLVYPDKSNSEAMHAQNQLIQTLSKRNVHISSELLEIDTFEVFDTNMINALDIASLSKQYLGKDAKRYDDTTYQSAVGTLTFKDFHMSFVPSRLLFEATTRDITLSNAANIAKQICAEYGIPTSDAQFGVSGNKDKISVSIMYTVNSLPIFNNALIMELSPSGLHSVSGTYFKTDNSKNNIRTSKTIEQALFDFVEECTDKSRQTVITDIKPGYMLSATNAESVKLNPVWRIIVDDTAIYYVEA